MWFQEVTGDLSQILNIPEWRNKTIKAQRWFVITQSRVMEKAALPMWTVIATGQQEATGCSQLSSGTAT